MIDVQLSTSTVIVKEEVDSFEGNDFDVLAPDLSSQFFTASTLSDVKV